MNIISKHKILFFIFVINFLLLPDTYGGTEYPYPRCDMNMWIEFREEYDQGKRLFTVWWHYTLPAETIHRYVWIIEPAVYRDWLSIHKQDYDSPPLMIHRTYDMATFYSLNWHLHVRVCVEIDEILLKSYYCCDEIFIDAAPPPPPEDQPPIAKFTFDPEKPRVEENVRFDAGDSDDPDGTIVSYEWDFGDRESATEMQATHTYNESGNYTATLTVTDNDGLTNSIDQTVTIGPYISSIEPSSGAPGITATINGWNFNDIRPFQSVTFGSSPDTDEIEWTDTQIIVRVPHGKGIVDVTAGPSPISNIVQFTYKAPTIDSISPSSGKPGTVVTIEGNDFGIKDYVGGWFRVHFGKSSSDVFTSNILSWTDTKIIYKAPSDYGTGENNAKFIAAIIKILINKYIPDELLREGISEILDSLIEYGCRVKPSEGKVEVDVKVFTPVDESNTKAFTYEVPSILLGEAHCPIDLEITDPDGFILDKNGSEIPKAFYMESDINGDGETDDLFGIPDPKSGSYLIQVIPEPNALPGDKYSLEIYYDGQTQILADQVLVSDIPSEPYIVSVVDKEFMITFDDGPIAGKTEQILNQLMDISVSNEPVKAGFFMVGDNDPYYHAEYELWPEKGSVKKDPAIAELVAGSGHVIGNHTLNHPWFGWYGSLEIPELESQYNSLEEFVRDEISDCNDEIAQALGVIPSKIFRPPYMYNSPEVYDAAQQLGFDVVWGKYAGDTNPFITSVEAIKKKALQILRSWKEDEPCVLIFHDNQPVIYNHIGEIIEYLQIKGFTLVHFDPHRLTKQIDEEVPNQAISVVVDSPVDLKIIDPTGLILSREENQIAYGLYEEIDVDGDSEIDDFIIIPDPKPGQYSIHVVPEPNASPEDSYTLSISYGEQVFVLAEQMPINEIPDMGYIWSFTATSTRPVEETVDYQVSTGQDDGYGINDQFDNLYNDYMNVGSGSFTQSPYYASGMIFRNVDILQGAEIISAHLKIRSYNSRLSDVVYGTIQAEASDDAAGFGGSRNIGLLAKTSTLVDWDIDEAWSADTWYTSPDISSVIQEIIDRSGWSEGNSLAIIYSTRKNEGGYRNISSFDRGSDKAPILEITYIP